MKDRHIAVALALIVVFGVFFKTSLKPDEGKTFAEKFARFPLSISLSKPILEIPRIFRDEVGKMAWATFESYVESAKNRDLDGVRRLSHQLSPACTDSQRIEECHALMNSIVLFTEGWREEDFVNVVYDDKQIILSTDYLENGEGVDAVKTVIYFTRDETGTPKILSIRFCFGVETGEDKCVETDPEKRDLDGNGWWDAVEMFFR